MFQRYTSLIDEHEVFILVLKLHLCVYSVDLLAHAVKDFFKCRERTIKHLKIITFLILTTLEMCMFHNYFPVYLGSTHDKVRPEKRTTYTFPEYRV